MPIRTRHTWRHLVCRALTRVDAFRALLSGRNQRLRRRVTATSRASLERLESRVLLAAVATTDKPDYAPGSTAIFTATNDGGADHNFPVGETIEFRVTRTDGVADLAPGNLPWLVTDGVGGFEPYQDATDTWIYPDTDNVANATIGTTWHVDSQYAGASLQLTARGVTSGETAVRNFTDSAIVISSNTNWSAITTGSGANGEPTASDSIVVQNGATLTVDIFSVVAGAVTLGNGTAGTATLAYAAGIHEATLGSLSNNGTASVSFDSSSSTLTVGTDNSSTTFQGTITGDGFLSKIGTGTWTLSGTASNTSGGITTVNGGTLIFNESAGANAISGDLIVGDGTGTDTVTLVNSHQIPDTSTVTLNPGGLLTMGSSSETIDTLRGVGTVTSGTGVLTVNSNLNPGASSGTSTGIVTTGNLVLNSGATLTEQIHGTSAGTDYDQTVVVGTITLTGSTLSLNVGFTAAVGDSFTLIDNDGTDEVVGTFSDLGNQSTFLANNGQIFQIQYNGGTGNDVVLRRVQVSLTVSGITAYDKSYDHTQSAVLNTLSASVAGVVTGDTVTLDTASASGLFATENVGNGQIVSISGLTISGPGATAGNYLLTMPTTSANITPATATVIVEDYTGVYDANPHTARVTITGVNGAELASNALTGANVMESGMVMAYAMDPNYEYAEGMATLTITPASATVSVVDYSGVYDANSHTASVTITGVGRVELASDSVTGTSVMDGGRMAYAAVMDSNYEPAYGTATLTITPASATVSVVDYFGVYDANSHTASVTITGVGGVELASDSVTGTSVMDGGRMAYAAVMDSNYEPAYGTAMLTITRATAVVSVTGYTGGTYDSNLHTQTVTVTGVGSDGQLDTTSLSGEGAGSYSQAWSYSNDNYDAESGTLAFMIARKQITGSFAPANKTYDSTTAASVLTRTANNVESGDDVSLTGGTATFNSKNVGSQTATLVGATLTGADAANYDLTSVGTTTANITPAPLSIATTGYTGGTFDQTAHTQTVTITGVGTDGVLFTDSLAGTNAGSYSKPWSYSNANYTPNPASGTLAFTIAGRDVNVAYIGSTYFVTSGSSATSTQVTLSASVQDLTGADLLGATISFYDLSSGTPKLLAANVKVSPVAGNTSTGTASTIVTLSTGNYGAESYQIETVVTGNYSNNSQALSDKTVTLSVVQPVSVGTIKGAGKLARLSSAVGTYSPSGPTAFTVGVSYNKSLTNLQGQVKLSLPQADGSLVVIKSNSLTSMTAANLSVGKVNTIYAKASIYRINANGSTTAIEGNVSLRFDVVGTGISAKVGFTILSGSTLRYSNNWIYDTTAKAWKTDFQGLVTSSGSVNVG